MTDILCYMPTYSPNDDGEALNRGMERLSPEELRVRQKSKFRFKPSVYLDAIDSVMNNETKVRLVVGDGMTSPAIRNVLQRHHEETRIEHLEHVWHGHYPTGAYELKLYPDKMSQWLIFNDILDNYSKENTEYFVYTSSDIIWDHDWIKAAIEAFEKDPTIMVLFPCVGRGDMNLPCQIHSCPRDIDPFEPPFQPAARAQVLNLYVAIFRMDFLKKFGGYPTVFRNCFTESFLQYMAQSMGGRICVLPRGWCYHHSGVDIHGAAGDNYHYGTEKPTFAPIMEEVLSRRFRGEMTPEFLSEILKCRGRWSPEEETQPCKTRA